MNTGCAESARVGPGGQGEVVVSATLLPFTDSLLEAVIGSRHCVVGFVRESIIQ
jgi:hypothetical protein